MASSGRIGSLAMLNDTMRDVAVSQKKLSVLQNQISSGNKSADFEGLNGSVEQFAQIASQIDRAKQFKANNAVNVAKLQTADGALSKITDIADEIKNKIVGANSATIGTSNLVQVVGDLLNSLVGELNATYNGHYIFSGTDTVNPPVPDMNFSNTVVGVPDDNYYGGSRDDATLRADDRTDLTFPVRADAEAFQKIIAAAKQAIAAASNKDTDAMSRAQQLIQDGQSDLIALRSSIGSTVNNIQLIDDRLGAVSIYWIELSDSISKTDIVAASTEVASYQAILQASFQVYARLSQLRLSDYLK